MRRWPLLLVIMAAAACSSTTAPPSFQRGPGLNAIAHTPTPHTHPALYDGVGLNGSEYARPEAFCSGLVGDVDYRVPDVGDARLRVRLHSLEADRLLAISWHNAHSPRGYLIATFRTNDGGWSKRRSVHMFRGGETRASRLIVTTKSDRVVATLRPC